MADFDPDIYDFIRSRPGYVGNGPKFLLSTSWIYQHRRDYLFDEQCIFPLLCSAVGIVAEEGLQVEPHGDYEPPFAFQNAQIRFSLRRPTQTYPGFRDDYEQGVATILCLLDGLCDDPNTSSVLGLDREGLPTLMFSHKLLKKKCGEATLESPDDARFLPVSDEYRQYLEPLHGKYVLNHLETFNGYQPTSFWSVKDAMKGAIVKVDFFMHYEINLGLQTKLARLQILKGGKA